MIFTVWRRWAVSARAWFPERHVYIRAEGRVQALVLTPQRQMMAVALMGGLMLWLAVTTTATVAGLIGGGPADQQAVKMRARYERLIADREARLNSAIAQLNASGNSVAALAQATEQRHEALALLISQTSSAPGLARALAPAPLKALIKPTPAASIAAVRDDQDRLLAEAETYAKSRAERLRLAYRLAGLDPTAFPPIQGQALGGPLVEAKDPRALAAVLDVDPAFAERIQRAAADLTQAQTLSATAQTLPLSAPTIGLHEASGFGVRADPFTGHAALHTGLDFAGPVMTPIRATAPGVVAFTGERSGYGRTIVIDHGHGLKTRFAHLAAISVAVGDPVALGQRIGALGSSGRSTGPHLHYEVWVKGRAINPQRFLEAGDDVRQVQ